MDKKVSFYYDAYNTEKLESMKGMMFGEDKDKCKCYPKQH